MVQFIAIFLGWILFISIIAFFTYMSDKNRARKGEWRIKESVLLSLGIIGGAVGALSAMKCFRHKTKHWYFWAVNIIALLLHIAVAVFVCLYFF